MGTKALLTATELEHTPKPLEGGGWELDEGELVQVSPNSFPQSELIQRIYLILRSWLRGRGLGRVAADTWFEIAPHIVRAPDVAFIPADRLAAIDPRHALKVLPALAVEVLGPSPSGRDVSRRVQQYREAGIPLIWVLSIPTGLKLMFMVADLFARLQSKTRWMRPVFCLAFPCRSQSYLRRKNKRILGIAPALPSYRPDKVNQFDPALHAS